MSDKDGWEPPIERVYPLSDGGGVSSPSVEEVDPDPKIAGSSHINTEVIPERKLAGLSEALADAEYRDFKMGDKVRVKEGIGTVEAIECMCPNGTPILGGVHSSGDPTCANQELGIILFEPAVIAVSQDGIPLKGGLSWHPPEHVYLADERAEAFHMLMIRLTGDGHFEGVVCQRKLDEDYEVVLEPLSSDAVKTLIVKERWLIYYRPDYAFPPRIRDTAGEAVLVQENPNGSTSVRGQLLDTDRGRTLKDLWRCSNTSFPSHVPWAIVGGDNRSDDLEIIQMPWPVGSPYPSEEAKIKRYLAVP